MRRAGAEGDGGAGSAGALGEAMEAKAVTEPITEAAGGLRFVLHPFASVAGEKGGGLRRGNGAGGRGPGGRNFRVVR